MVVSFCVAFVFCSKFNSDVSAWNVARVDTMHRSTLKDSAVLLCNFLSLQQVFFFLVVTSGLIKPFFVFVFHLSCSLGGFLFVLVGFRAVFYYATAFDSNVDAWNVAQVTDMSNSA